MSAQYRLICPACGAAHVVTSAQAGLQIACDCGQAIEVPTWRGLQELDRIEAPSAADAVWSMAHGLIFIGMLIAVVGFATAAFLLYNTPPEPQVDRLMSLQQIDQLSPADSWEYYQIMSQGLESLDEIESERRLGRQIAEFRRYRQRYQIWSYVLLAVGLAGLIVTGIGLGLYRSLRPQVAS